MSPAKPVKAVVATPERAHVCMAFMVVCVELASMISFESFTLHVLLALGLFGKDVAEVFVTSEQELKALI